MEDYNTFKSAVGVLKSGRATAAQKAAAARKVAETHATYNLPFMSKAGLFGSPLAQNSPVIRRAPKQRRPAAASAATGSYSPAPLSLGTTLVGRPLPSTQGAVTIEHRELFHTVHPAGTSYETNSFYVNPGLNEIFSWLHGIAQNFDQYQILNIAVEYIPHCGADEDGAIYLSWDPDPNDPAPTGKAQLMSYGHNITSSIWKPFKWTLPASQAGLYVRHGAVLGNALSLYDHGQLHIATQGVANISAGDLYVTYKVRFHRPHTASDNASAYWAQVILPTDTPTKDTLVGSLPFEYRGRRIVDPSRTIYSGNAVVFYVAEVPSYNQSGSRRWLVKIEWSWNGTGVVAPTITSSDSTATVTQVKGIVNGASTAACGFNKILYTSDPTGTTITFTATASTTITNTTISFFTAGHASVFDDQN